MITSKEHFVSYERNEDGEWVSNEKEEDVVRESFITLHLNGKKLVRLLCSPDARKELSVGYLVSEGILHCATQVKSVEWGENKESVFVEADLSADLSGVLSEKGREGKVLTIASSGGRIHVEENGENECDLSHIKWKLKASEVSRLMKQFLRESVAFSKTGGVHSAALIPTGRESGSEILRFRDDIGRHNAMDKLLGGAMVDGWFPWMEQRRAVSKEDPIFADPLSPHGFAVMTSGRISSEILTKVSKRGLPIILTKAAPTYSGIQLARKWGMTLIAFVRGLRMNVYSNAWRITTS